MPLSGTKKVTVSTATGPIGALLTISLGDVPIAFVIAACVVGDFFYWLLPLPGLTVPAIP